MNNAARQKLAAGQLVLCMGLRQARSPDIAMIAAECGFDAINADMEHSPLSLETVSAICVGALGWGVTPLVRPPSHAGDWISRALDTRKDALIVARTDAVAVEGLEPALERAARARMLDFDGPNRAIGTPRMLDLGRKYDT